MANRQPVDKPEGSPNWQPQQLAWWRYLAWFFVLVIFSWYFLNTENDGRQTLSYSEFKISVVEDQVARVRLQGDQVIGEFHQPRTSSADGDSKLSVRFVTTLPPVPDPELISLLEQHNVEIHAVSGETNWLTKALIGVLPWILIIGLFWYASSRMQRSLGGRVVRFWQVPGQAFSPAGFGTELR
jgi:cell division protease FtsH